MAKPLVNLRNLLRIHFGRSIYHDKYHKIRNFNQYSASEFNFKKLKYVILAGVGSLSGIQLYLYRQKVLAATQNGNIDEYGKPIEGLPTYSSEAVRIHNSMQDRVWITYKNGVYDITDFLAKHPGGYDKVLLAAGSTVEPFWELYGFHYSEHVLKWLETYRIGNLKESDVHVEKGSDMYEYDPVRHPALIPSSLKPFNAETPLKILCDSYITPNDLFYVRNHLPVPEIEIDSYELQIELPELNKTVNLKMEDLKNFPKHTVTAAIQCAGNRRSEMTNVKPLKGLSWKQGAIGNATWSGPKLLEVLQHYGFDPNNTKAKHVQFEGLDFDVVNTGYGASVPIDKLINPYGDIIIAYEMNGKDIPRDHGYPVRAIVPGVVGARNVKWLGKIIMSEKESDSHWQQSDYKGFSPSVDWDNVDFSKSPAIQELPVTSAICDPINGETVKLKDGKFRVKGYAWSGGGRSIERVDFTIDQGKSWNVAKLTHKGGNAPRAWGWTLWEAEIEAQNVKEVEIWVKAVDSSYNTQPESFENIWNLRGVLSNAYHKIIINIA